MLLEDLYPGMDGSEVHPIRVDGNRTEDFMGAF